MCWAEHTDDTEAEQGVMTSHWADGFLFVGWLARDGMVVTVLTESAKSLPGKTKYGVAIRTVALRIICLMLLIRTAALWTVITHSLLCRAADNQSQYLIYTMWSLAAISNYEPVVRWR